MASTSVRAKTILVADDTAFVRDRFRTALEQAGHQVLAVQSATELLERVRADPTRIDLIVLDLQLAHADGIGLVQAVRKLDDGRIVILVFSGTIATASEVRALATLGVAGYVNEYSGVQHIMPSLSPHLFPDRFNRRSSPRVLLAIPVQYRVGTTVAAALTLNISYRGVAIRTTNPLSPGSKVRVRFRLPDGGGDIAAEGRVAWSDQRVGMGIQFARVEPTNQTAIDEFVDAHFFSNRKA